MTTMLLKKIGGHMFGVDVSRPVRMGDLANGARGYEAQISFYRSGKRVGVGRWDGEDFQDVSGLDGRPLDLGDCEVIAWREFADMVREHLGYRNVPAAGGLALAL